MLVCVQIETGGGRQDGETDVRPLDGGKEVGWAALLHLLFLLASLCICHGVKKVGKQCQGGYFNIG